MSRSATRVKSVHCRTGGAEMSFVRDREIFRCARPFLFPGSLLAYWHSSSQPFQFCASCRAVISKKPIQRDQQELAKASLADWERR